MSNPGNGNEGTEALQRTAQAAMTERQEFNATETSPIVETASTAVAEQARALVEARHIVAMRRPRDLDTVRVRLAKECRRPGFAEVARYSVPRGGKHIVGPSIRFAEAAIRTMGNIDVRQETVYDDPQRRIVRVSVVDLESNASFASDIPIEKVVERRKLKDDQAPIAARQNSSGQMVYLVRATEDDLLVKQGALVSKAIRNAALRLLPGDLLDECMEIVDGTLKSEDVRDPDEARKRLADAFAGVGVMPVDLKRYLGHELSSCSPAEIGDLRLLYQGMKDGEATWADVLAARTADQAAPEDKPAGKVEAIKEKIREAAEKKKTTATAGQK